MFVHTGTTWFGIISRFVLCFWSTGRTRWIIAVNKQWSLTATPTSMTQILTLGLLQAQFKPIFLWPPPRIRRPCEGILLGFHGTDSIGSIKVDFPVPVIHYSLERVPTARRVMQDWSWVPWVPRLNLPWIFATCKASVVIVSAMAGNRDTVLDTSIVESRSRK